MGAERDNNLTPGGILRSFVGSFVDGLARAGVTDVCVCPGSRSTPLALLLRSHPAIKIWMHLDERSAAFFALGMAKARRAPVAVLSTSGTAATNFAPAVVEAYYAHVPLLVLTADRPPELRGVGANQTIDQVRLYEPHVKWYAEALLPEASPEALRHARTLAARAVATTRAAAPGPVHINLPFREPLVPSLSQGFSNVEMQESHVAIVETPRRPDTAELAMLADVLRSHERGLIVCGPQDDPGFPAAVTRLAKELGFPLIADALSQVRCGPHYNSNVIVDSYDAFLRGDEIAQALAPEVAIRFGATPVSKPLLTYLERNPNCRQILVADGETWNDPALVASDMLVANPRLLCEALIPTLPSAAKSGSSQWLKRWQQIDELTGDILQETLRTAEAVSEPGVFSALADALPKSATVFVGNSMPVRDLDTFFPGDSRSIRFFANRGASGIDGVVSSALGASAAGAEPLVLVIGDLSLYHDMNGLLAVKQHGLKATIILINNDGGGIFSFLSQADEEDYFEELFGTPHGLDFRPAAEMYGLAYRRMEDPHSLPEAIKESIASVGSTLIEVRTDRTENVEAHRNLWRRVSQAWRETVSDRAEL